MTRPPAAGRSVAASTAEGSSPRISVVTPTFNRAELVVRAVRSVLAQTMDDFEVIVVDDGSRDDTRERLAHLHDPRVRYVEQAHRGAALARNLGVEVASADLIAFLDSDDEAETTWLESIAAPFASAEVGIVCAGFTTIQHGAGGVTETVQLPEPGGPLFRDQVVMFMAGAFALRREVFVGVGGYRDQAARQQKELGRRVTAFALDNGYQIATVATPLIRWHQHDGARISTDAQANYDGTLATIEHEGASIRATSRREHARLQRSAAVSAMRLGRSRDAARHLRQAIRSDPRDWRAYVRLAEAWLAVVMAALRERRR